MSDEELKAELERLRNENAANEWIQGTQLRRLVSKHRDRPYRSGRSAALDQGEEPKASRVR